MLAILASFQKFRRTRTMNEAKTSSMLQRVPVILAVTAASYGLQLPPSVQRTASASPKVMQMVVQAQERVVAKAVA
jgi:hypothetical protein